MTSIREFTGKVADLCWADLINYISFNRDEYSLREITTDTMWYVEAYFDVFKDNKSFTVVFNKDVVSPHRSYNHLEMQEIIDKLDKEYKLIKEII